MRKIPTLFVRDEADRRFVTREVTPGCHWVTAGLGVATRKWDGTCVRYHEGHWWARREVKPGKAAPPEFLALETDPATGKTVGWMPAEQSSFWPCLQEALAPIIASAAADDLAIPQGTYELCGPKINGDPEAFGVHRLVRHGVHVVDLFLSDQCHAYEDLLHHFARIPGEEGLVFYRTEGQPDSGMVKIKRRDFRELAS